MPVHILEEIQAEAAALPLEKQMEVLDFVKFIALRPAVTKPVATKPPFKSVRGALKRSLPNLAGDLAEIRREMWQNFPREEPQ